MELLEEQDEIDLISAKEPAALGNDTLTSTITRAELIRTQCADEFFKMNLASAVTGAGKVVEDTDGIVVIPHPDYNPRAQILVPEALSPIFLNLEHRPPDDQPTRTKSHFRQTQAHLLLAPDGRRRRRHSSKLHIV